jgi:hypothetical protein
MPATTEILPASACVGAKHPLPGPPSLDNQSEADWEAHREVAYVFARHVRHDMVNVQCSLQLIEVVEKMRELGGDMALPPELQPEQVKIKVKGAIKQIASMCNDLVLLSQASNPAAYRGPHALTVRELLEAALGSRLGDAGALPVGFTTGPDSEARVVAMGDMLQAAVAACCFQWTPWLHATAEPIGVLAAGERTITLTFPILDPVAGGFSPKLARVPARGMRTVLEEALTTPTSELALWLARFIILLHGGTLTAEPGRSGDCLCLNLPRAT